MHFADLHAIDLFPYRPTFTLLAWKVWAPFISTFTDPDVHFLGFQLGPCLVIYHENRFYIERLTHTNSHSRMLRILIAYTQKNRQHPEEVLAGRRRTCAIR